MQRILQAIALGAIALTGVSCDAEAGGPVCHDRAEILKQLESKYGEEVQALGLSSDGAVLELLVSPEGGWTIIVTRPGRPTCIVAAGEAWSTLTAKIGQPA